jgi:hypothetical protein
MEGTKPSTCSFLVNQTMLKGLISNHIEISQVIICGVDHLHVI